MKLDYRSYGKSFQTIYDRIMKSGICAENKELLKRYLAFMKTKTNNPATTYAHLRYKDLARKMI